MILAAERRGPKSWKLNARSMKTDLDFEGQSAHHVEGDRIARAVLIFDRLTFQPASEEVTRRAAG